MTNKDLPYSTGKPTQYSVTAYMGKEAKRLDTCICISEWIHFVKHLKTNTAL